MNTPSVIGALAALAQESRLAVFRLLVERGPVGFSAGEIGDRLDIPGPTLSFHLKGLAQAGLVTPRRESRFVYYTANFERMNALVAYLTKNCCSLGATCTPVCNPSGRTERKRKSA